MPNNPKTALRQDMKAVLGRLDPRWVTAGSHRVGNNILNLLEKIRVNQPYDAILGYTSFFPGEVDLSYFFSLVGSLTKVFLPTVSGTDSSMNFFDVSELWHKKVLSGSFSLAEETDELIQFTNEQSPGAMVVVPGIAFDKSGNRIGRGKGYYDRFLAQHSELTKVGVCWDLQLLSHVPVEPHDQPLDWICTESSIISCRK